MSSATTSLLLHACEHNDLVQVHTIISEMKADPNCKHITTFLTPLHLAAQNGNISMLEYLLSEGADPNAKTAKIIGSNTALHFAVQEGHIKVIETLLNHFANPNLQNSVGFTPLHIAARKGFFEITMLLLSKGASSDLVDEQGKSAYYWAKEYRHEDVVSLLPEMKYNWKTVQKQRTKKLVPVEIIKEEKKKVKKKKGKKKKKKKK